jgi:hypothetical protein
VQSARVLAECTPKCTAREGRKRLGITPVRSVGWSSDHLLALCCSLLPRESTEARFCPFFVRRRLGWKPGLNAGPASRDADRRGRVERRARGFSILPRQHGRSRLITGRSWLMNARSYENSLGLLTGFRSYQLLGPHLWGEIPHRVAFNLRTCAVLRPKFSIR